jgi:transcriptional regulator with XRE-family HTH domain
MAEEKLFAGHAVRRIRRATGLTQAAMAEALQVSPS